MQTTITVCDSCKKILNGTLEIYRPIYCKTDRAWDGADMDWNTVSLELCEACARRAVVSLEQISKERLPEKDKEIAALKKEIEGMRKPKKKGEKHE